jgi:hypothetical protein
MRLRAEGIPRGLAAPSELEIFVPKTSALIVRAAAASLVISDFDVSVDVATAAGNLLVEAVRGPVRAETMQGTLTVLGPIPRVEASTASGALLVSVPYDTINDVVFARRTTNSNQASFHSVILRSVSGRITFDSPLVDSARIHNVRGDVRVITSPSASGRVQVTSHAGRVIVGWTDSARANVDALTQKGGMRGRVPTPNGGDADVNTLMRRSTEGVWLTHTFGRAANATQAGPLTAGPLTAGPLTAGPLTAGPLTVRAVRGELVFERVDVKPAP